MAKTVSNGITTQDTAFTKANCLYIPYQQTGYYAPLVLDYLAGNSTVAPFYKHPVSLAGLEAAMQARDASVSHRATLVAELRLQYAALQLSSAQQHNLDCLEQHGTYTITTAHQPNIFTGPLYFIYKILHAIRLAADLNKKYPNKHFVPMYYMGSEDADLDELGHIHLDGMRLQWNTRQTGAVGRMTVDNDLVQLIDTIAGRVGVLPFGNEFVRLLSDAYVPGTTIQQATLKVVHALFKDFGLLILIPDSAPLKGCFANVMREELLEGFSHRLVEETANRIGQHYKVQATGRNINLFYLINNHRERIELENGQYLVKRLGLAFNREQVLNELAQHPERFSPNVILRGVFQETILPNIAFIGGGGELAYWLELKAVFEHANVPYPVLVLRNSFMLVNEQQSETVQQLELTYQQLFDSYLQLSNWVVQKRSAARLTLTEERESLQRLYQQVGNAAGSIDTTLAEHVQALHTQAQQKLVALEKKMLRAEKRHFDATLRQLQKLKAQLFPFDSLQERVENMATFYARFGPAWLQVLLHNSQALEGQFAVLEL